MCTQVYNCVPMHNAHGRTHKAEMDNKIANDSVMRKPEGYTHGQ